MTSSDASIAQFLQQGEYEHGGAIYISSTESVSEHRPDPAANGIKKNVPVGSTRQQAQKARSRNSTPPPAPRRCTVDLPATPQPCPTVKADRSQAVPTCCSKLPRLFAAMIVAFLLLCLPALLESVNLGFANSAALKYGTENPAVQKIVAFASSAKVAVVDGVTESPTAQKLAELATSTKQSMIDSPALQRTFEFMASALQKLADLATSGKSWTFEFTASATQKLADLATSAKSSLLEAAQESPALQKAFELMISAKEAVQNFCTELCNWVQSMHPTSAAADAECTGPDFQPEWQVAEPMRSTEEPVPLKAAVVEKPSPPQAECIEPDCQPERQAAKRKRSKASTKRSTEKPAPLQPAVVEKPSSPQAAADAERIKPQRAGLQGGNETPEQQL